MRALAMAALALAMLGGCSEAPNEAASNSMAGPEDYAEANAAASDMTTDDAIVIGGSSAGGNETGNEAAAEPGADGDEAGNVAVRPAVRPMARGGPRAGGVVYCELIQDSIPAAECEHYREVWSRLETGEAALDAPPAMTRGVAATVSFALARASAPVKAGEILDTPAEKTAAVRVGRRMAAKLEGEGFTIEPAGLVERDLFAGGAGRWDWTVTPTRGGPQRLRLGVYVMVRSPDGASRENLIRTLSHDIDVAVAKGDLRKDAIRESKSWLELANEWLLALAALVGGGLLALVIAIRKFRAPKGGKEE